MTCHTAGHCNNLITYTLKNLDIYIFLLLSLLIVSCNNAPNNKFIGNWASYNHDEGYVEVIIRDSIIEFYSLWGDRGSWWYKIQNDTILIQHGFKGHIKLISDSVCTVSGDHTKDTLYRLGDSILTYNSNLMSSGIKGSEILLREFEIQFFERKNMFLLNHNIIELINNDTTPIIEEKIIQGGERK